MTRINDLLQQLCPNGVDHVSLGHVAGYSDTRVDASTLDGTTFVGVDNLLPNAGGKADASFEPNTDRLTGYEPGDVLLGNIRPYLKKAWLASDSGGCSGDVLVVRVDRAHRDRLLSEFLYYVLSSDRFFAYDMRHAKGAKMPRGDKAAVLKYNIPVPPVEVQREIVEILGRFTELTAEVVVELAAELAARKKQYAFYRDQLLTFPDQGVRWSTIGELCRVSRGRVISKDYLRDNPGEYPVYSSQTRNNGIFGYIDSYDHDVTSITWTTDGANAGSVFWHQNERFSITNVCGLLEGREDAPVHLPFVYHQLACRAKSHVSSGMGNPKLMAGPMAAIRIPVPPLDEQERIVSVLDKFDALVNQLSFSLPAEIEARQTQYQHCRERLLEFEESAA